jgi:hypothetical protein
MEHEPSRPEIEFHRYIRIEAEVMERMIAELQMDEAEWAETFSAEFRRLVSERPDLLAMEDEDAVREISRFLNAWRLSHAA